jgi:hypothetical protein
MNASREKLREFLDRGLGLSPKGILVSLNWFPLLDLVCLESKAAGIGYICLAQILHINRDGRLAVGRSKRDPFSVDVKTAVLLPKRTHTCDL